MVSAALRCCAARSADEALRWRIDVSAAVAIAGGSAVVKMKSGRVGAHRVDHRAAGGDIAAERAEGLGQRPLDHVDAVHDAVAFGDAAAARPIHADRVHLVEVGHGAVCLGEVGDLPDRGDVAVHRIDRFEGDQLRPLRRRLLEQAFQVGEVVVAEDQLLGAGAPDALDHRGVVQLVGKDDAAGQQLGDGRDRRFVGDEAGGEDQPRLLAVQVGEFRLELHQRVVGARNVARAAGAGAHGPRRRDHGLDDRRVLPHAQIVVRAPHDDFAGTRLGAPDRVREAPGDPLQVGEDAVAALGMKRGNRFTKNRLIVHQAPLLFGTVRK